METDTDAAKPARRPRIRWTRGLKLTLLAWIVMLAVAAVRQGTIYRDVSRWESYRTEWEAKGEVFTAAPYLPVPVPAAENFAAQPWIAGLMKSSASAESQQLQQGITPVLRGMMEQVIDASEDQPSWFAAKPERAADFLREVAPLEPVLTAFREAAARPHFRVDADLSKPEGLEAMDWSGRFSELGKLASVHAEAALVKGDEAMALADLEAMFRTGESLRGQRQMLCTVIAAGFEASAMRAVQAGLKDRRWSAEAKRRLLAAFPPRPTLAAELCQMARVDRAMQVYAAGLLATIGKLPQETVRQRGGSWWYPPQRLAVINEWDACALLQPVLDAGGTQAAWQTLAQQTRNGGEEKGRPALANFSRLCLKQFANVAVGLFSHEERADEIRRKLAE